MSNQRTPRAAWIDSGLRVLADRGPDAVRVESLARDLGVTKGGFYWYFADRNALLTEMLDAWEERATRAAQEAERTGGDARTRATTAARLTFANDLRAIDRAVRAWARHEEAVAKRLRRVDNYRMDYLRSTFAADFPDAQDLEARCLLAFAAALAAETIAADHPQHTREEVLERATTVLFAP